MDIEKFFGVLREKQLKEAKQSPGFWSIPYWPDTFRQVLSQVAPRPAAVVPAGQVPERTQVLMGLYQLAKKESEETGETKVALGSVNVALTDQIRMQSTLKGPQAKWPAQAYRLSEHGWEPCPEASAANEKFDVVFLGMELGPEQAPTGVAWDLLLKMARALSPKVGHMLAVPVEADWDSQQYAVLRTRARFVIGLGSKSSSMALQRSIKLNDAHGKFYDLVINHQNESVASTFVPLFHPEFLSFNPNMKRTAWEDLQKIMSVF